MYVCVTYVPLCAYISTRKNSEENNAFHNIIALERNFNKTQLQISGHIFSHSSAVSRGASSRAGACRTRRSTEAHVHAFLVVLGRLRQDEFDALVQEGTHGDEFQNLGTHVGF